MALALPCAFGLHFAFPQTSLPWLAPFMLGGLFAAWTTLSPRKAALNGYLCGLLFFAASFSWFGESAGALLGPFGFVLDLGPALLEGLAFALAAAITAWAAERMSGTWLPVMIAASFSLTELLRSCGLLGVPLYQIGAAFVETPLAPLAAYGGVYAITFVVALLAAQLAVLVVTDDRRSAARRFATMLLAVGGVATLAWIAWPARTVGTSAMRVAAVQGNIRQSVKWNAASLPRAVERYTRLSQTLKSYRPQFVLWPETVITTDLVLDPAVAAMADNAGLAASDRDLEQRFARLAHSLGAVLAVGTVEATPATMYNALEFITPTGRREAVYRKRQLVPFAEFLPGPGWLRSLPFASLVSSFGAGTDSAPIDTQLGVAPMICWEAGFSDLAQRQAAAGARFFAIATDDAWFGDSDGPYAQAQIAQLRAIETGRWIVRAAATGISGIIAPNGRWQRKSTLDSQAVVAGTVGEPQPTVYSKLGPLPVGTTLAVVMAAGFRFGRRRRSR